MTQSIDQSYLKEYSRQFAEKICSSYFDASPYISGEGIVKLTPSTQVNLMVIKSLFVAWQSELEAMKKNPYFDYHDPKVEEALQGFMNTLSRAIKVDREHFSPLLAQAVEDSITLAVDPALFFDNELQYSAGINLEKYFKGNNKYIKWHKDLWAALVEKTEKYTLPESLSMAFEELLDSFGDKLEDAGELLAPLNEVVPLDLDKLIPIGNVIREELQESYRPLPELEIEPSPKIQASTPTYEEEESVSITNGTNQIDAALAWAKFEREEYGFVRGSISKLSEDISINQRFMFTRKLFSGNPDALNQALGELDKVDSFYEAVELINSRFISSMGWEVNSEEMNEFLLLVFRKFEQKG